MSLDISSLSNAATAATALSNLVLVTPQKTVGYQPQNSPSWTQDTSTPGPALLFNYEGEQSTTLTSDITDHYVEDNSALQDHIAIKPVTITTHGFVGELNDIAPSILEPLKIAADRLLTIGAFTPQLSVSALQVYAKAKLAYDVGKSLKNSAVSAWSSINGASNSSVINGSGLTESANKTQTQQQVYFQQLYGYWRNRNLFTIQTPWAIFQDMAIMNLRAVQDAESRVITDFEITFKQLRFSSTLSLDESRKYGDAGFQSRLKAQGSSEVNLGTNTLEASPVSFAGSFA